MAAVSPNFAFQTFAGIRFPSLTKQSSVLSLDINNVDGPGFHTGLFLAVGKILHEGTPPLGGFGGTTPQEI